MNRISKEDLMELIDVSKLTNLVGNVGKKEIVVKEKTSCWKIVLGVVVGVAAVAGIAYAVYRYFNPDLDDEFMDDFEDWDQDEDMFDEDVRVQDLNVDEEETTFEEE